MEVIEHVYAVPGAGQTLRHSYLPDDDPPEPVPRPRFVHAYCDVADARPPDQPPQPTPASPAYAEVEEMSDADVDEKTRKRFQFRFRKRPSVSSSGTSSLYEDVNPLPVGSGAGASKSSAGTAKNNTLPKCGGGSKAKSSAGQIGFSTGGRNSGNSGSPGGKKSGKGHSGGGGGDPVKNKSSKSVREAPVYVHVVDTDGMSDSKPGHTSKAKAVLQDKSAVAPLAAKFIETVDKSTQAKTGLRGKTDAYSSRLYPLQEGRVATLVSTLNRNKEPKNGVTAATEQNKVS